MDTDNIRSKAQALLKQNHPIQNLPQDKDLQKIIEELQVHQIELELQNEELRRTTEELHATRQKYLDLYNRAPVGYLTFDSNGIILELNLTAARLLGTHRKQLRGRTLTPYLAKESIVDFYQHCHTTLAQEPHATPVVSELELSSVAGNTQYVQLESVAVYDENDTPHQINTAMIDVTPRKLTEEQLRISEGNWAALVNTTEDLIWAVDQNFTIIRANDALKRVVGKTMGYRLEPGSDVFRITPPDLDKKWRRYYSRALSGKHITFETQLWGETLDVSLSPFVSNGETVVGVVVYAHNISERKVMEKTLRTRNRELDNFAFNIAHDLQTPLNLITGYANYLLEYSVGFDQDETLTIGQKLDQAARQASKIVDELIFLATVSRENFVPTPLEMAHIVQEVQHRLTATIEQAQAKILAADALPAAMGYRPWVEKVWLNLLTNAIQTVSQNEPFLLEIAGTTQQDGFARFWIRTQPATALHINIAGRQAAGQTNPDALIEQSIELSVVNRVIQRMNGEIGVVRLPDDGLEFFFTLPASDYSDVTPPQ